MASLKRLIDEALEPVVRHLKQIHEEQVARRGDTDAIKADLQLIKQFLGVEGGGATPEQLEALGQRIADTAELVRENDPNAQA